MASTTIPNLPVDFTLTGQEWVWINVNGIDQRCTLAQIAALAPGGGGGGLIGVYVTTTGLQLFTGFLYSLNTLVIPSGGFGTLPPLSTVRNGAYLEVQDVTYNAGANNYTVSTFPGDGAAIAAFGANSSSYALTLNDAIIRFTKYPSFWRATSYGF